MRRRTAVIVALAGLAGVAVASPETAPPPRQALVRGLDHVVVAVRDLEQAVERYRSLGFTLKPGQPHANGIRNQHVKFPDGTEIELLTVDEPGDALAAEYKALIEEGDGPVFASLYAPDRPAVATALREAGFVVNGGAGLITFPPGDPLRYLFFGGRNQSPTDQPEHFVHANTASSLHAVSLVADDFSLERRLLDTLELRTTGRSRYFVRGFSDVIPVAELPEGELRLFSRQPAVGSRRIEGVTLTVRDLDAVASVIPFVPRTLLRTTSWPGSLFLAPERAHGLWIEFREMPGVR